MSADPNQTVQAFIDLCARHEEKFYKFVHEVHLHDNGLFDQLMGWIEGILHFLRNGPNGGKLDMNALVRGAASAGQIIPEEAKQEIEQLISWQEARKRWHHDKTRQKLAQDGNGPDVPPMSPGGRVMTFTSTDFGLDEMDLEEMDYDEDDGEDEEEEDDELDPITAERKRRARKQAQLRRSAGEPKKPEVHEIYKLHDSFVAMLRMVLAN
jgi:hypothetical protein